MPLIETSDGLALNEPYMQHIDYIVDQALHHGLYFVLTVAWSSVLDKIFPVDNPAAAHVVAEQLGRRYRDRSNIIWIVCGEYQKIVWAFERRDRLKPTHKELTLINALAEGLERGHGGAHLMTAHPDGSRSSSEFFHDAA
jgi:hypothetical protein